MSVEVGVSRLRERRRADTLREIKTAALDQLSRSGPGKLSLRGVAREVGMTVQSLYHYVDSFDALLSLLVLDSYHELATAVSVAAGQVRGRPLVERLDTVMQSYRGWAVRHPAQFLLIYGTPVPGYSAPEATREPVWRLAETFRDAVFADWSPAELGSATPPAGAVPAGGRPPGDLGLPADALSYFLQLRATMHGVVMLEVLDHLVLLSGHQLIADASRRAATDLEALRATPR